MRFSANILVFASIAHLYWCLYRLGRAVCHAVSVNQVVHAHAFIVVQGHRRVTAAAVVGGDRRVTAAAISGGQFEMATEGAQLRKNTTFIIGKLKTWRVVREIVRSIRCWEVVRRYLN